MKHSIKKQMAAVFIGLITFILIAFLAMNANFLEKYYVANKENELTRIYMQLAELVQENELNQDTVAEGIGASIERGNISFMIMNEKHRTVITNVSNDKRLQEQLIGYLLDQNQKNGTLLESTEYYQIQKATDPINHSEYVEMWGELTNEYRVILRTPLESIRESVSLSNQFLVYVGSAVLIISAILVWYFSRRIANPILELAEISERMAHLDFDAKYTRGGDDEIGVLGANFNVMSKRLEDTISELKSANHKLQSDIEKKEALEAMRTEFLGNVSHELKTPIALIQGYAEGLKEGISEDPESRAFYCDVIMDEATKMNQMVKNLLTLNQLEFGDSDIHFERFDIVELIHGVLQSMDILIQQKEAKVNFAKKGPICVWSDEFKVEQVVRNYISNALNHLDGERVIDIKIQQEEEKARISVFNTGKQIPEEDVDKIWDKFYKVDKAHTREYGGNGIGLSIVKAIMESFHQEYGMKNYANGVEFWFEIDVK